MRTKEAMENLGMMIELTEGLGSLLSKLYQTLEEEPEGLSLKMLEYWGDNVRSNAQSIRELANRVLAELEAEDQEETGEE